MQSACSESAQNRACLPYKRRRRMSSSPIGDSPTSNEDCSCFFFVAANKRKKNRKKSATALSCTIEACQFVRAYLGIKIHV